jgi:hypothetical protein
MALAVLAHIVEDQLGFMGSNLWFPVTQKRTMGLKLLRSGDATPNFLAVWVSLAVILLNLDRFSASPTIPVLPYLLVTIVTPCLFFLCLGLWANLRARRQPTPALQAVTPAAMAAIEALDETDEVDL